jgi:hypothetical protein
MSAAVQAMRRHFATPAEVVSFDMGTKSMGYARVRAPCEIVAWGIIDMQTNASRECTDRLFDMFEHGEFVYIKDQHMPVVVEAQPADGACKVLTHGIQMFLLKHGEEHGYEHWLMMMAPNNKLQVVPEFYDTMPHATPAQRKAITMRSTDAVLRMSDANRRFKAFYKRYEYKQKTDLADALMQAIRFLQLMNPDATQVFLTAHLCTADKWLTPARQRKFLLEQQKRAHADAFDPHFRPAKAFRRAPTADDSPVEPQDIAVIDWGD